MANSEGNVEELAHDFALSYSKHFSSPKASSSEEVGELAKAIGQLYRPGVTFFTNGKISRFEVHS